MSRCSSNCTQTMTYCAPYSMSVCSYSMPIHRSANLSPPPLSLQIQNLEGRARNSLSLSQRPSFPQIDGASPPWSFLDDAAASSGF
ncbi:hypothetical protein J3F84DRAFT_93043 [Trichoderma pleuroticola]